jgi:hypothetical protein
MFSILFASRESGGADVPLPAQVPLIGTCVINGSLVARVGSDKDAYNPFDLYGESTAGRKNSPPPHLVFAELEETDDAACAFLDAYGPLRLDFWIPDKTTRAEWHERSLLKKDSRNYFRDFIGINLSLPSRPRPASAFHLMSVKEFWTLQSDYELTVRLLSALQKPAEQRIGSIKRALAIAGAQWTVRTDQELTERTTGYIKGKMNLYLKSMTPRVTRTMDRRNVEGVWACYSLYQALYLMLFLDIASRSSRIVTCQKCGRLFYADRERVTYCSEVCENRARSLRAYHRKVRLQNVKRGQLRKHLPVLAASTSLQMSLKSD